MTKTVAVVAQATIHVGRVAFAPGQPLTLSQAHADDLLAAGLVKLPGEPDPAADPAPKPPAKAAPAPDPAPDPASGG